MTPGPQGDDLGQHRLVDVVTIRRIVDAAGLHVGERVLDAGAGAGALTGPLAAAVGPTGRVIAVERVPALAAALREGHGDSVEVVEADLLDHSVQGLDAVVANPPFRIVAPLIERWIQARIPCLVLVAPRELIERLQARPGSARYGRLTIRVALQATTDDLGPIPRHAFDPPPEVPCGLVRIRPRAEAIHVDAGVLARVLDVAFQHPDRKAKHTLAALAPMHRKDSAAFSAFLDANGWADVIVRALPPDAFGAVARHLSAG